MSCPHQGTCTLVRTSSPSGGEGVFRRGRDCIISSGNGGKQITVKMQCQYCVPYDLYLVVFCFVCPFSDAYLLLCLFFQLILEAPEDIFCFAFCPTDHNIIAGGCYNGQVIIWDISAHVDRLKAPRGGNRNKRMNVLVSHVTSFFFSFLSLWFLFVDLPVEMTLQKQDYGNAFMFGI